MSRLSLLLLLLLGLAAPAHADVFRLGDFSFFRTETRDVYELVAIVPEAVSVGGRVTLPDGCDVAERNRSSAAARTRFAYTIRCARALTRADVIRTPWPVDGGTFASTATGVKLEQAVQPDESGGIVLPVGETTAQARPLAQVATAYTWQGVLHILGGWDHLAFILCLCLLARGRTLLLLVTAFTAGHSLSLGLAFYDVIQVPVPPVEAVIALSIAFMAREALKTPPGTIETRAQRQRYLAVVTGFGLLHGLGFATVLRELGVVPAERASGLVFFNAGVEIGQLLFVGCVLGVMAAARRLGQAEPVRAAALYGAGTIGCFWMIERVAGYAASGA